MNLCERLKKAPKFKFLFGGLEHFYQQTEIQLLPRLNSSLGDWSLTNSFLVRGVEEVFKFLFGGLEQGYRSIYVIGDIQFKFLFGGLEHFSACSTYSSLNCLNSSLGDWSPYPLIYLIFLLTFKFLFGGLEQNTPGSTSGSFNCLNSSLGDWSLLMKQLGHPCGYRLNSSLGDWSEKLRCRRNFY